MKIYDISQEVFSCKVYPGDPCPTATPILRMTDGAMCNLSAYSMCAHNGTHIDAPFHFISGGKTVDRLPPESFIGMAYVTAHEGYITAADAETMLEKARVIGGGCDKQLLVKGRAELTEEAAAVLAGAGLYLYGNESQTVGPENAPMAVHKIMLGGGIVLLEGIRLGGVDEGTYLLNAAPLNLSSFDGSPCRAVLLKL